MAKTAKVELGGTSYVVPMLNIGQLKETYAILKASRQELAGFDILGIAMKRADPSIPDIDQIETSPSEVAKAVHDILQLSGLQKDTEPKNEPAPATEGASV